jgi:acyl-CoA hydrolase
LRVPSPQASVVEMTQLILPMHANNHGTLFGGQLVAWMDMAASIAAMRHAHQQVVTVAIDQITFQRPIRLGQAVLLRAKLTWAGRTSMEVKVEVEAENLLTGARELTNTAFLTFVAVDADGRPVPVPPIEPSTAEELADFEAAAERRRQRLERR